MLIYCKDENEMNAIDLTPYKPSKKVIDKLTGYFNKGSKVNVGAIKDPVKMLTYFYAAQLLNWGDLGYDIRNTYTFSSYSLVGGVEFGKIREAIDELIKPDPAIVLTRSEEDRRLLDFSKKIWQAVKASGLEFDFKTVPTTSDECWKDARNGCAWTIAYDLTVGDKTLHFSEVTNEGVDSPSFGWQFYPCGYLMGKTEFESIVLSRLGLA